MARDTTHALSFGKNVADYERGRPGYPGEAVEWMLAQCLPGRQPEETAPAARSAADAVRQRAPLRVVDVGAGTGKFTAALVPRASSVTAVEPDDVMPYSTRVTLARPATAGSDQTAS